MSEPARPKNTDVPEATDHDDDVAEVASPLCSAKGCRSEATWVLAWNNPKLHPPERRKTWAACDEHLAHLTDFLQTRGFLRETVPARDWAGGGPAGS